MHPGILGQKRFPLSWGNTHLFLGNHPKQSGLRFILRCKLFVKAYSGKSVVMFLKMSIFLPAFASLLMQLKTEILVCCYESPSTAVLQILNRTNFSSS